MYSVSDPKLAILDPMDLEFDDGDDLSTVVGIETLTANDMLPEELARHASSA